MFVLHKLNQSKFFLKERFIEICSAGKSLSRSETVFDITAVFETDRNVSLIQHWI
jgi:hypothetical protein